MIRCKFSKKEYLMQENSNKQNNKNNIKQKNNLH